METGDALLLGESASGPALLTSIELPFAITVAYFT
jgi:hypothetical protein